MEKDNKGGRPKKEVDTSILLELAKINCTVKEMAAVLKCSEDTLARRDDLRSVIEEGREHGKMSVRRMLWNNGEKGNNIALKYLIHNILKEKIEEAPKEVNVNVLTPQEEETKKGIIEYLKSRK